jgi:pimeloyl-ACP methyl ester carboxylesterase
LLNAVTACFKTLQEAWHLSLSAGVPAVFMMAILRLHSKHRQLSELECINAMEHWHPKAKELAVWAQKLLKSWLRLVVWACSLYRIAVLSPLARKDYYALLKVGRYAVSSLPCIVPCWLKSGEGITSEASKDWRRELKRMAAPVHSASGLEPAVVLPVVIVPGLNTPGVFFREMVQFLQKAGFPVWVVELPNRGMASLETSADVLKERIETICLRYNVPQVAVVGHCMGGLLAKYIIDTDTPEQVHAKRIKTVISLGTGFMGAEGVSVLKEFWQERHPHSVAPEVFDQLLLSNFSLVQQTAEVAYHSILTVWDMMVRLPKGLLKNTAEGAQLAVNHIVEDPAIDHLTLVLHPKILKLIEQLLQDSLHPPASLGMVKGMATVEG